jgi:hypothetical protein
MQTVEHAYVGGYKDTPVTPEIIRYFHECLPDINAKLGTKWTYMIILACWSQVVAGTNYKGYVAGDGYDCAHVVIFKPLGDGKPEVKEAFKVMD